MKRWPSLLLALVFAAASCSSAGSANNNVGDRPTPSIAERGAGAEEAIEANLPEPYVEITDGDIELPTPAPITGSTPLPTPPAGQDLSEDSATAPAMAFEPQVVQPVGSHKLVRFESADFSTPEAVVQEFFAAFTVGDWPLVYELFSRSARSNISASVGSEQWTERTPFANSPVALKSMSERYLDLYQNGVSGYGVWGLSVFEIGMEEAVSFGALPLDMTQGIYALEPAANHLDDESMAVFTARLRATDESVEIYVLLQDDLDWRVSSVSTPSEERSFLAFAGSPDASSQIPDPATQWSSYDALSLGTPEAALDQIAELSTNRDWRRLYLMLDPLARIHVEIAAGDSPRRLFDAGDNTYGIFQPDVGRTFASILEFGATNHRLGVPLVGYDIVDRVDTIDERGGTVAVLSATHTDAPGTWAITMTKQSTGWHLRQIQKPGAPIERIPFSFESTIQIERRAGDEAGRVVEISDLKPFIEATVSYLSEADLAAYWDDFEARANHPGITWSANAYVEQQGVFWVDWKDADSVQWSANNVAEFMGFEPDFRWDSAAAIASYEIGEGAWPVVVGMQAFDEWLGNRGYHLVALDPGWDAYIAVVVPNQDAFAAIADEVGITTWLVDG